MAPAAGWSRSLRGVAGAALVLYPPVVWLGLERGGPREVAALLLVAILPLALVRLRSAGRRDLGWLATLPLVTATGLALSAILDAAGWLLAMPVAINALLLLVFAWSLRPGSTPMITRFARLEAGALSAEQERWCRTWTVVWCLFFVANGTVAAVLAGLAPLAWWAAYTGGLAYGLIGALLVAERLLRRRRFRAPSERGAA